MMPRRAPKSNKMTYIDNSELEAEIKSYQDSLPDGMPSERLGKIILDLCNNILLHKNWNGYKPELKEDMRGYAVFKILKYALKSFKFGTKWTAFNYLTRIVFTAYMTVVMKYYKQLNYHQEYVKLMIGKYKNECVHNNLNIHMYNEYKTSLED